MKNITLIILIIILLNGCSQVDGANPSQNKALNTLAGKEEKTKKGFLQNTMDSWVEKEWTPTIEKDEKIKEINKDEDRNFTIQEFIDKASIYNKSYDDNNSSNSSHIKKINSLPVIGNIK
ncbi:hypothetical protein HUE87_10405 [Candidatus Sulfurimonas marisnigri]|uniref:Lipoprotein n=1 Tax=Candidatus Sulfurimonas marisnigri TaxID=2740405 RepID=A0A7S7LZG1_9BACT|nr:hypothetical protein [Candidatus Sulfurimonas marisnigri]QOY54277.1 hypothetical protein HUE87_10405 [Candidatus Sulfurimonas marisnigri]